MKKSMTAREELLSLASNHQQEELISHVRQIKPGDLSEALGAFSKVELKTFWEGVQETFAVTLLTLEVEADADENEEGLQKLVNSLQCMLSLATCSLQIVENKFVPHSLLACGVILNGLLPELPDSCDNLKNNTSKLFEIWWNKELEHRENIIMNSMVYLLERSLRNEAAKVEVKRVWAIHEALSLINFSNHSSDNIKELLFRCIGSSRYLQTDEGVRFLGYVMSLDCDFITELHRIIKFHIPNAPRSWHSRYGEVYFLAWKQAEDKQKQKLETSCIQDLMHHCILGNHAIFPALRTLLFYLHKQKKQKGMNDMLYKLYEPILWRHLKVANSAVRLNAVTLLLDAFPLVMEDASKQEAESQLQQQFDIFHTLLKDPSHHVRSKTVQGVFKIMSLYWEMIPSETLRGLISIMLNDLLHDAASPEVRETVLKGLCILLKNHLSHLFLKPILPEIKNVIHDTSERVRIAMMELLMVIKGLRAIKYWNVVPVNHLLARLACDSAPVVRRIMKLIFNSFMPMDQTGSVKIFRIKTLIESNPAAARQFFKYISQHMDLNETAKYMILLCRSVLVCIKEDSAAKKSEEGDSNSREKTKDVGMGEGEDKGEDEDSDVEDSELTMKNVPVLRMLIEGLAIIWTTIGKDIQKPQNEEIYRDLVKKFCIAIPEMLGAFEDAQLCNALVLLAGYLPHKYLQPLSRSCLSKLRKLKTDCTVEEYSSVLESLCSWGRGEDILDLVIDWLKPCLTAYSSGSKAGKVRKSKSVCFVDPNEPQPQVALSLLQYLLQHPVCQEQLLQNNRKNLAELAELLHAAKDLLTKRLEGQAIENPLADDILLTQTFTIRCKLLILLHSKSKTEHSIQPHLKEIYTWLDRSVHPVLTSMVEAEVVGRKRQTESTVSKDLAVLLIKTVLEVLSNMLLCGLCDTDYIPDVIDFCLHCISEDEELELLPAVLLCLFQATEFLKVIDPNDAHRSSHGNLIPGALSKVFVALAAYAKSHNTQCVKMLQNVKSHVFELMNTLFNSLYVDEAVLHDIMSTIVATAIAELTYYSQQLELQESFEVKSLPLLTSWLLQILNKKVNIIRFFIQELCSCVDSGALSNLHNAHGVIHLMAAICEMNQAAKFLKAELSLLMEKVRTLIQVEEDGEELHFRETTLLMNKKLSRVQEKIGTLTG
ncbi:hypothetical protein CHS0354_027108 [Potamilus streckersoni]|uniref:Condensin-2 complex subunit G2 n=1 Tax=Potamilus streckersoni TaxID=2493646 RepID=A0AAE0S0R0_9BIVA|nr:hypothetical protein CHS0354_027108 [Potamilus streckersoni]